MVLHRARPHGMSGPLPIPMQEVLAYCEFRGIRSYEDREDLLRYIIRLDDTWLADFYKKQEQKQAQQRAKSASKTGRT